MYCTGNIVWVIYITLSLSLTLPPLLSRELHLTTYRDGHLVWQCALITQSCQCTSQCFSLVSYLIFLFELSPATDWLKRLLLLFLCMHPFSHCTPYIVYGIITLVRMDLIAPTQYPLHYTVFTVHCTLYSVHIYPAIHSRWRWGNYPVDSNIREFDWPLAW